jgi:CheY-like chemotaxis protein
MPCVLIVEDDADLCEFMNFLVTANGYETMRAHNGKEALEQMRLRRPCLVLLDLHMPVMDGWEFRRRQLHDAKCAAVPVVVVTAHFDPINVERTFGVRCIQKPIHIEEIIAAIKNACGDASAAN